MCCKVKEEASQGRSSDTLHVDPSGLVTLTTPNRLATVSVRAIPLPLGKTWTHIKQAIGLSMLPTNYVVCGFIMNNHSTSPWHCREGQYMINHRMMMHTFRQAVIVAFCCLEKHKFKQFLLSHLHTSRQSEVDIIVQFFRKSQLLNPHLLFDVGLQLLWDNATSALFEAYWGLKDSEPR